MKGLKELLTVAEFAEQFRINKNHLYKLIREDMIPCYRIYGKILLDPKEFRHEVGDESSFAEWARHAGYKSSRGREEGEAFL